ncbi:uncharacterized protein LOC131888961 [Tigriopus californicus]|uniref:uncharacterized protein LOC131888961 n=1 Tax=Tigriopus californicus TaxID=6832 RepID=UPI0027DA66B4|nr:uncharacterized protein LOC131888961 [Tigriopus californicus]
MMNRSNRSFVWDYFENLDPESAVCKLCMKVLRRTHSSTSALSNHLRTKHEILEDKKRGRGQTSQPPSKRITAPATSAGGSSSATRRRASSAQLSQGVVISSTQEFMDTIEEPESVEVILAKLVTVDEFPLSSVIRSDFVREVLAAKHLHLPTHDDELALILIQHAHHLRSQAMEELADLARIHMKFSLSLSEWQSGGGQRYFGVNCHGHGMSYSLGMIRLVPDMRSEAVWTAVRRKVREFGLDAHRDIVAATTDELSLGPDHQSCLAHGIHQAVLKVLYPSCPSSPSATATESEPQPHPSAQYPAQDRSDMAEEGPKLVAVIGQLIDRTHAALHDYMSSECQIDPVVEQGLDQVLLLSWYTPWTGLLNKVESLLGLKPALSSRVAISEADWTAWQHLSELLRPLQMSLDALSAKDSTLLSADGVCVFMLLALEKLKGPLAEPLRQAIKDNVTQRRQHELVSLLKYLNNPRSLRQVEKYPFQRMPIRSVLERTAFRLGCRLFPEHYDESEVQAPDAAPSPAPDDHFDLSSELQRSIDMATYSESLSPTMREQMNSLESSGQIGEGLQLIQQALSTLPPTCLQMRRCVPGSHQSGFEHFGHGHPARLLDALIFLKGYYDQRG